MGVFVEFFPLDGAKRLIGGKFESFFKFKKYTA